jgi:hypothetical protein
VKPFTVIEILGAARQADFEPKRGNRERLQGPKPESYCGLIESRCRPGSLATGPAIGSPEQRGR